MLKLKRIHYKIDGKRFYDKTHYIIYDNTKKIGEICFKKKNNILVIIFFNIFESNKGYGTEIIDLFLRRKIKCIIGETFKES